jgi:hypothetical protein
MKSSATTEVIAHIRHSVYHNPYAQYQIPLAETTRRHWRRVGPSKTGSSYIIHRSEWRTEVFHLSSLKEVIQPQVPLRLPCYDFTPIINQTVDASLPRVGSAASGPANFRGVTGGVYKARERIHRGMLIHDY